jgi:NAD(P)H-flavin reductase/hemoglobin-like flavoprotein
VVDVERLKRSWAQVEAYGDQVPLRFYSRLFVAAPQTRELFPLSMVAQRDRLVGALGLTVSHVDDLDRLVPYLQQLGRDHRRFGVLVEHYGPVADALLATLSDFLGQDWTPDLAQDWTEAYGLVAKVMTDAANEAAQHSPPYWIAEVVAHERRTFDIAVLTVQPEQRYEYVPGQSLAVETPLRPRLWRYYSPANAPRDDGSFDLHVHRVPGGPVSGALVDRVQKGDPVHLGPPVGFRLTLPPDGRPDLLLIAGGTGLAPLKALVDQVAERTSAGDSPRNVSLFVGARKGRELYDLDALRVMELEHPWLRVTSAVADDPLLPEAQVSRDDSRHAEHGEVGEVAARHGRWPERDVEVYICGRDEMVRATVKLLSEAGCPHERIHYEGFRGLGGEIYGLVDPTGRAEQ